MASIYMILQVMFHEFVDNTDYDGKQFIKKGAHYGSQFEPPNIGRRQNIINVGIVYKNSPKRWIQVCCVCWNYVINLLQ